MALQPPVSSPDSIIHKVRCNAEGPRERGIHDKRKNDGLENFEYLLRAGSLHLTMRSVHAVQPYGSDIVPAAVAIKRDQRAWTVPTKKLEVRVQSTSRASFEVLVGMCGRYGDVIEIPVV